MKVSYAVGVTMAVAAFALTASVTLACPAVAPPNVSNTWVSLNTNQQQGAIGNITSATMTQNADTSVKVWAGDDIWAKSVTHADQRQVAENVGALNQAQSTSSGARIQYPWGHFPAQVTVGTTGGVWQNQSVGVPPAPRHLDPTQTQNASVLQQGRVGDSGFNIDGSLNQRSQVVGTGFFPQSQHIAGSGQAQAWAVPPFPTTHTFAFNLGNNVGRLFQHIDLTNVLQFGPF